MRPRDRRSVALAIGAILTLALAGSTLAVAGPGPDGMAVMRVRDAHGSHGRGPGGGGGNSNPNLYSHGGSIEAAPKVFISFWGNEWNDSSFQSGGYTYADAEAYIEGFFRYVGGGTWINSTSQYCYGNMIDQYTCSTSKSTFVGNPAAQLADTPWNDTTQVPNRPKQSDIAAAATRLMQYEQSRNVDTTDATFFVFTPSGKSMSGFGTRWCAWHASSGSMAYAYVPFIPDAGGSCGMNFVNPTNDSPSFGDGYFDGFSIVGGHEYAEAETDPFPSSGWLDSNGAENGDKCAWYSGPSGNIQLNGDSYAVQSLWSNATKSCVLSY